MSEHTGIGASVLRREDARFISGNGTYTDDLDQPGQVYAAFCRSPYAHAHIKDIDTAEAAEMEGVLAVYTGQDTAAAGLGDLPCGWLVKSKDGSDMISSPHPPLAVTQVTTSGNPMQLSLPKRRR